MKKVIALFLVALLTNKLPAQSEEQISRLSTLGRTWGFLKYYHPAAAAGHPDWDSTLIVMIPRVQAVSSSKEFNKLLINWYNSLPPIKTNLVPTQPSGDSVMHVFNNADIDKIQLPLSLKKNLHRLFSNHIPDTSRYITRWYEQYHLDYILHTEDPYADTIYPNMPTRLLSLFRYWNTITFFYPHRSGIHNWDEVLTKYIPVFMKAADASQYRSAVLALTHELPDSHSFYSDADWNKRYQWMPFFKTAFINEKLLITTFPKNDSSGSIIPGDEILSVDGIPITKIVDSLKAFITGTNTPSLYRNIAQEILAGRDSIITLELKRNRQQFTRKVKLGNPYILRSPAPELWKEISPGIWHVNFCLINKPDTLERLFRDVRNARGLIWDMRAYPHYEVCLALQKWLMPSNIPISQEWNASAEYPGAFILSTTFTAVSDTLIDQFRGRIMVLVNEQTQSLSESVAAMLRLRPNTYVMGSMTAGTTGNISRLLLPGGIRVTYTGVKVEGREESFRQGKGVKIDYHYEETVSSISGGVDGMVRQALRMLSER